MSISASEPKKGPAAFGNVPVYDQKLIGRPSAHECTAPNPIGRDAVANHGSRWEIAVFKSAALAMLLLVLQSLPSRLGHTTIACGPLPGDGGTATVSADEEPSRVGARSVPGGDWLVVQWTVKSKTLAASGILERIIWVCPLVRVCKLARSPTRPKTAGLGTR